MLLLIFLIPLAQAVPFGANTSQVKSERAPEDSPKSVPAQAGNVTELNVFGYSTTRSWQGYFGNVSGTIQLADSDDKVMYNWSYASPKGEIYASTSSDLNWGNIQCFNFTAKGTYGDDTGNAGETSQYGMNLTQLESNFSIDNHDVDGVNETFIYGPDQPGTHDRFYTNNLEFGEGECRSTRVYTDQGQGEDNKFEEVLLYEPQTTSVVFASLLNEDVAGFDEASHDFEMLVLEDGHETDTSVTPYYFYVELG